MKTPISIQMRTPILWTEQFNVTAERLESWRIEAPQDMPILFWCLLESKIPGDQYLSWARDNYGMVSVNRSFFENSSALELKSLFSDPSLWSPWCVPLGLWDGITYIGCVAPPSETQEGTVYVLADAQALKTFHAQAFQEEQTPVETPSPSLSSEPIAEVGAEELPSSESEATTPSLDTPEALAGFEMPEGLTLVNVPKDTSSMEKSVLPDFDMPAGLNLNLTPVSASSEIGTQETNSEYEEPPALPEEVSLPSIQAEPTNLTTLTQIGTPAQDVKPNTDFNTWWTESKTQFTNCEVLMGDLNSLKLIWKNGEDIDGPTLSLTSPSLFRIALRTQKPYHGFVIENDVHKIYFGDQPFPKTVTAITYPIDGSKCLLFLLYGFTGEPAQELQIAEALTEKFHLAGSAGAIRKSA